MTDLAPPPTETTPGRPTPARLAPTRRRDRGRRGIAAVMAASLALSAATRFWADHQRTKALPHTGEQAASTASLSSMNSFALGLLLGGLRGPLVMILWTDSENLKTEKNLEGVDTEIEWIRLLQPEFDTVHLFQIWNKAYNISVQMASLANKYDTILGALDYARSVDAQKPDDINIIAAIGQLYFDKLGTSSEKYYYRRRVREESKPHAVDAAARRSDTGWRRVTMDPVLDAHFDVLPSDRADLMSLDDPRYAPYTDGVSTFGFAFNYYKRADLLLLDAHQHHDQLSDVVIDSRPALSLKMWADDEVEQARHREAQAFGATIPDDAVNPDAVTAGVPVDFRPWWTPTTWPWRVAQADYARATQPGRPTRWPSTTGTSPNYPGHVASSTGCTCPRAGGRGADGRRPTGTYLQGRGHGGPGPSGTGCCRSAGPRTTPRAVAGYDLTSCSGTRPTRRS